MDCQVTYKGKDYTYDQFATLLHSGELEVLAPKMDSRYFIINEGYNPFENSGKAEVVKESTKIEGYKGIFNPKKTGISGLDDLLEDDGYNYFYKGVGGEVVMMSPDEYLKRVREGLNTKDDANVTDDKKDAINKAINEGNKINMPFISTRNGKFGQEGRNRAVIAKERGEKLIPVFIEKDISFEDKIAKGEDYIKSAIKEGATTKEQVLSKLKEKGLHRDGIRFIDDNFDDKSIEQLSKAQPLEQAKKNLSKAWNKLGNQGIVYDPIQNERDFIDFVKALFDYVKVYGRDKAIPEMVNYVKGKLGIGEGGGLNKKTSDSVKDFATQILEKYNALTPKEINAVLTAYSEQVGKGAFEKNVDTLLKFGKLSIEKAQQFKELYQEVSDVKSRGEEERAKLNKDKIKFESPIQILARDMGDNPDGEVLTRLTAITTDRNQERSPEELQREATYVEETLPRLRNIAFEDASMIALYYNNASDWVDKFLTELESEKALGKKGERVYDVPSVRMVGILNVMNNVTYENIMKSTDPIEKENLLKLRKRLDAYTNDFMRGISLALGARRSDAVLAEFARGGVMSDYATSRILTKAQLQQIDALQKAITSIPTKTELNDVNIPSDNPIKKTKANPSTTKGKQKATTKKVDAKFESDMKEKAKGIKIEEREKKAKDLRDRLFNAINKCK